MVEFEPNRAYGFLGNRISDDNLGTEGRKEGRTDREMVNYRMMTVIQPCYFSIATNVPHIGENLNHGSTEPTASVVWRSLQE